MGLKDFEGVRLNRKKKVMGKFGFETKQRRKGLLSFLEGHGSRLWLDLIKSTPAKSSSVTTETFPFILFL